MKKIYFLLFTLITASFSFGQDMLITGAFDGPLTGGTPKLVEIYVINDIADLSIYGFGSANNGGGTDGQEIAFAGSATAGDFIYVASEGSNPGSVNTYFGITADYLDASANVNGDDALELFLNSNVIDTFGDINTDGTGQPWEYLDGWAYRVNGTGPDGANFVQASWAFSSPNAVDNCTDNGTCASAFPIGTYSTTGSTTPSVTITSPGNNATLALGTTSVDIEFSTANLAGGETVTITVNGSATPNATSPFAVSTAAGQTYTVTADLVAGGSTLDSDMITFSVASITQVADITALRAGTVGNLYELTGEAIISYIVTEGTRNQKYIQDGAAGILIDDTAGNLSTPLNIGDGITGLKGTLSEFSGTLQFVPSEDLPGASSTGNTLTPIVISASDLLTNGETYESRLITLNNVTFSDTGVFADNTNYDVVDGTDTTVCRVAFGDEDLIGTAIPTTPSSITGLGGEFNGTYQIFPRFASDIAAPLSINEFDTNAFSLYPNPTNTGFVSISSTNSDAISVSVFDILGKQVKNETITNNTLDVSNLNTGIYIVKITQNNASITKKLVIR